MIKRISITFTCLLMFCCFSAEVYSEDTPFSKVISSWSKYKEPKRKDIKLALNRKEKEYQNIVFDPSKEYKRRLERKDFNQIVVTPDRTKESILDISREVIVITEEDIARSNTNYITQLIQDRTGVVVSDYLGNPKGVVVDVRGFGETSNSNLLVLIDGRRTNQVDLSGVDWAQIDINSIKRIEIVPGPGTVMYGDNASSGVINIITKKGKEKNEPTVTIGGELGSYKYKKAYVTANGSLDHLDAFFSYSHQETEGYRSNNDYWSNDFFGKVNIHPSDMFNLDLSIGHHRDKYGMPGALYPMDIQNIGLRGTTHPDDRASTNETFFTFNPEFKFDIGSNACSFSIFNSYKDRRAKGLNVVTGFWGGEYETVHHIRTYELRPKFKVSFSKNNIENKFVVGIDYFNAKDAVLSGNRIGSQQDKVDIIKQALGIYGMDSMKFREKFLINLGIRGEWADYSFEQEKLVSNSDSKKIKEAAITLGCGYKYNEASQVYFNYSRSFRLPNTEEYYQNKGVFWGMPYGGLNTDIKHQQSNNFEVGVRDNTIDGVYLSCNFFLMDIKNEIYFDPTTFKNSNYEPKTRHYGVEMEGRVDLLDGMLRPYAALTLQKSYFKGGTYNKNEVPFVSKVKFAGGLIFTPIENLNFNISCNYVGSRYLISDQKNIAPKLKGHIVWNTAVDYQFKYFKIWLAVRNFFDKKYYAYGVSNSSGVQTFYPAIDRVVEFGLSCEF